MDAREDLAVKLDREATRLRYLADRFTTDAAETGAPTPAELARLDGVIRELDALRLDLDGTTQPPPLESQRTPTPVPDPSDRPERARDAARACGNGRTASTTRCGRWACVCTARENGPWT